MMDLNHLPPYRNNKLVFHFITTPSNSNQDLPEDRAAAPGGVKHAEEFIIKIIDRSSNTLDAQLLIIEERRLCR